MLDAWEPNNYIRLKANPLYFAGRANFDTVTFWVIPDSNTMLANFMAGKLDVSVPGMGLDDPDQANVLRERAGDKFFVQYIASAYTEHLEINFSKSQAAQDVRLRQALQMAINREELNRRVFRGFRVPGYNIVPIDNPFELKTGLETYAYNPAKANELLDEAGYKKGADGIRRDPQGNKLHFVISTTTSSVRAREFPVIQAYWKEIGVETEFKPMASNKFFGDILPRASSTWAWPRPPMTLDSLSRTAGGTRPRFRPPRTAMWGRTACTSATRRWTRRWKARCPPWMRTSARPRSTMPSASSISRFPGFF